MSEGPAVLPDQARTVDDRVAPAQSRTPVDRAGQNRPPPRWEWLAVGAVVWSLYAAACACPAYYQAGFSLDGPAVGRPVPGWEVLAFGWLLALLYQPVLLPWSANLLLLCGWVAYLRGRGRAAAGCGLAAAGNGFVACAMPGSEVERLLFGYYLWQASLLSFAVASAWCWQRNRTGLASA